MSTRVITPPSMDLNRDITQNCPDGPPPPSVVAIPQAEEGLPEGSATSSSLGCPSPAISPNSGSTMFPMIGTTEHILSMKIRTVPRCLFGPPDPRTAQFAREKVKEIYEHDKNRYNFDFDAEKPLEGPLKWEAVPVAPPTTTSSNVGSYAPKAYALTRLPYLSGGIDRGNVSPPRTTINNNQLPPARQLYFQPEIEREPLFVVRGIEQDSNSRKRYSPTLPSTPMKSRAVESTTTKSPGRSSSSVSSPASQVTSYFSHHLHHQSSSESVLDPAVMLIPSPEASSCSSEDSAHVEMELGEEEEEEVATSVESSSTEDDLKISNVLSTTSNTNDPSSNSITGALSTSSGISSRLCTSSSSSRTSSISSSTRRTKSVSSSSPSRSASPSSPTSSSQPQITRFLPVVRKRPASTSTGKAASDSAPTSSAAATETKRAAM
ncbi:unnamed protein product [Orchesella dallaii]|uniref:Cyclin-dependent kinase inhibitor domain-containing protein n=1 Tax=Orchesella dallaii TaxID=48710 RepID=A0ABP1RAD4_9HEXA